VSAEQILELISDRRRMGEFLRHVRIERNLSRVAFGELIGIDDSSVSRVERGLMGLSIETLRQIAGRLDDSVDAFIAKALAWTPDEADPTPDVADEAESPPPASTDARNTAAG
jgi:transcriptional regulator with XRE-family HTH domain